MTGVQTCALPISALLRLKLPPGIHRRAYLAIAADSIRPVALWHPAPIVRPRWAGAERGDADAHNCTTSPRLLSSYPMRGSAKGSLMVSMIRQSPTTIFVVGVLTLASTGQVVPGNSRQTRRADEVGLNVEKLRAFGNLVSGRGCVVQPG